MFRVFVCILLLGAACCQSFEMKGQEFAPPRAQKGMLDLRNNDFSAHPISLNGEWAFYWKQLVQPNEKPLAGNSFTQYPQLWNNTKVNGQSLPAIGRQ